MPPAGRNRGVDRGRNFLVDLRDRTDGKDRRWAGYRATVVAISGDLVTVRAIDSDVGESAPIGKAAVPAIVGTEGYVFPTSGGSEIFVPIGAATGGGPPLLNLGTPSGVFGAGSGAGSGADLSWGPGSSSRSGRLVLVSGSTGLAAGYLATITTGETLPDTNFGVTLSNADSDAGIPDFYFNFASRTTTTWDLYTRVALAANTSYHLIYLLVPFGSFVYSVGAPSPHTHDHPSLTGIGVNSHDTLDTFLTDIKATTFITRTPSGVLDNEQSLSLLATGLLKNTATVGVLSIAAAVDLPVHTHTQAQSHTTPDTDTATIALHHTLGVGANQAAAGNHGHAQLHDAATVLDTATVDLTLAGQQISAAVLDNTNTQKSRVSKAGALIGTRREINLIEGANATLTVVDNATSDRVDVTIAAAGGESGGAPTGATYITQTPDATLTAEQALSALPTGLIKVTTGTGILSGAAAADLPAHVHDHTALTGIGTNPHAAIDSFIADMKATSFITQGASGVLNSEQALSALATGLLKNTNGTGVLSVAVAADLPAHSHPAADITSGQLAMARIASGVADGTKFVADDGTLKTPAGGGGASPSPQQGTIWFPPGQQIATLAAVTAMVNGTAYAVYLGKARAAFTSISIRYRLTTAHSGVTWSEMAIATGAPNVTGAAVALTRRGWETAGLFLTPAVKNATIPVTDIAAGDDLWFVYGSSATTMPALRAGLADDIQSGQILSAAIRPSLMAANQSFAVVAATLAPAWLALRAS